MIKKAIRFAVEAHKSQKRKGTNLPYIEHPVHVALLLTKATQRDEVIAAGILHDVLEDTDTTESILESEFGHDILMLVKSASEEDRSLPWKDRKKHTIDFLMNASKEVQMIALCDKLSNIIDIEADLNKVRSKLWERFNAKYEDQKWYYESLIVALKNHDGSELYDEFSRRVRNVFG